MIIESTAFENNGMIPAIFTCDGQDISPHLVISEVPEDAQSLALIVTDPDAPGGTWTHWIIWNIDKNTDEIQEGGIPEEATEGLNSGGGQGYQGPCPPSGVHHYIFKLYAIDTKLNLSSMSERQDLEQEISGHILEESELIGLYGREA
jgi:Raf kinase inhibitor-like YbhB/YbcL family protein